MSACNKIIDTNSINWKNEANKKKKKKLKNFVDIICTCLFG